MTDYVVALDEVDRSRVTTCGGKAAHLGELLRIEGVTVPSGFCVTTDAFRRVVAEAPSVDLSRLDPDDRAAIRQAVEAVPIPEDVAAAITGALERLGAGGAYAVRSSATVEDSPTASFAGQHETFLNVVGPAAVLRHVSRCWASLFTERAVTYRLRNGLGHVNVAMAVVVQRMVDADAAGVLFTAHPVTGHRKVSSIEAVPGLGDALVDGRVDAGVYTVRDGAVGTVRVRQDEPVLTDDQAVRLARLGRRIEAHFGSPQDVEWCLAGDEFAIVQSRPITTLFPVPAAGDGKHVFVSVGHQQMMTDPIKPLGLSVWQMTAFRPMYHAAGRLFVDVFGDLSSPASRATLLGLWRSDPLTGSALQAIADRGDFVPAVPDEAPKAPPTAAAPAPVDADPALVAELVARGEASLGALRHDIATRSGEALLDFVVDDIQELKRVIFDPRSQQAIRAGMEAAWWLNDHLREWLGETNAADVLSRSVPHNVTSEMGLALLDVADAVRPHPEVVAVLERAGAGFLDELPGVVPGGREARDAIVAFLDRYGMRCTGEIDVTRPRWSEHPLTLVPLILGNVRGFEPGAGARLFERGRREAERKERDVLARLKALPDGERKAGETKSMIDRLRAFAGYREYPKYVIVNRYFAYKQALLREARRLVDDGALDHEEDVYHLTFDELREVVRTRHVEDGLVAARKEAFASYAALTPPRVLTSDGEVIAGAYDRDGVPDGALVGIAVSAGTVEGRARVVLDLASADLAPGDVLVTAYTDPSWTPLFVAVTGLVTEVGGVMTHGAVIAREYGLPAVVGVEGATRLIRDGQRIRVRGTDGYVELL